MKWINLCLVAGLLTLAGQNRPNEWSYHRGTVEWKRLIVPTETLDTEELEKSFRRILNDKQPGVKLLQVEVMDRQESIALSENGYNDISFSLWQSLYKQYEKQMPPFAELLVIGDDAGMKVRSKTGEVSQNVLSAQNPYNIGSCGGHVEIAHVSIQQNGVETHAPAHEAEQGVNFFVVVDRPPDKQLALCIFKELRARAGIPILTVCVRPDPWFLQHSDYPVVSPFFANTKPPTKEEYETAVEWECHTDDGIPKCSGGPRLFQFAR